MEAYLSNLTNYPKTLMIAGVILWFIFMLLGMVGITIFYRRKLKITNPNALHIILILIAIPVLMQLSLFAAIFVMAIVMKLLEYFFGDVDLGIAKFASEWIASMASKATPLFNTSVFVAILAFVVLCAVALFFITRTILGREVKLSNTFWEHKDAAQSKILWCNALFFIMLFLIFLTAFSCFGLIFTLLDNPSQFNVAVPSPLGLPPRKMVLVTDNSTQNFLISLALAFILVAVIFCTFIFQKFSLAKHSIDKLAKTLNATEITESSNLEQKEQMLLNVITEMAIASSCPMPRVFILKEEKGINAMCSGEYFGKEKEKIAIFVTQGALDTLSRDELQGVIGHEFSHAFHRDVALNLRIFALVFALSYVVVVGEVLLRAASNSSKRTSRSKDDGKGFALLAGIALVFFALGYVGMFFAQIIQAAISRQKEFLADASSTQYTRNPQGIKSALQKIAQVSSTYEASEDSPKKPTYLTNPKAGSFAHMFFLPCRAMIFATHPPLEQRILRLEQMGAKQ